MKESRSGKKEIVPRKRILLIDDCKTSLLFLEIALRGLGYEILKATDSVEALFRAARLRPDLILMDLMMPDLSGLEILRALRGHEDTRHIPVVLVTVRGDEATRDEARRSGCDDYLTKPVSGAELRARVQHHLGA